MGRSGLDQTDDFQKFCGSGLDQIQFFRIRTGLGLKNFIVKMRKGSQVERLDTKNTYR